MANDEPFTRETLLLRLRDPENNDAWGDFVEIYAPMLHAYCRKRGLSESDGADVVQEVMRSVAKAMPSFTYDPAKGRFRGWIFTVVRHELARYFKAVARRPMTPGDTQLSRLLEEETDEATHHWERDYQNQLLRWACDKIRIEFSPRIWQAFEETALKGRSAKAVGAEIDMPENTVGVAKHRVKKRLIEKLATVHDESWERELIEDAPSTAP